MPIVRIIAEEPVQWTLNNIGPPREYDPNEIYDVPPFVADGMVRRGWARILDAEEIDSFLKERQKAPQELPPFLEPKGDSHGGTV